MDEVLTVTPEIVKQIADEYGIGEHACNKKLDDNHLLELTKQVGYCLQWISTKKPTQTVSKQYSYDSYSLKHMVEYWFEIEKDSSVYVSTSALTIAAIIMKYPFKLYYDSPNSDIGLSRKTITRNKNGIEY